MNPAFSVVCFTLVAGAAQGLVVALALAGFAGVSVSPTFVSKALIVAEAMLLIGLGASFAHLGRPMRAWRAVLMWRTSWLSREVIVLPAFIGIVGIWWLALRWQLSAPLLNGVLPIAACALAALLWYCTAMIYACLRFVQEWAQPLTLVNFALIGLSSGSVLLCALAALSGEVALQDAVGPCAVLVTLVALITRVLALRHNRALHAKSTLQSATGIHAEKLVQKSMGMSAGAFNTREFFHGRTAAVLAQVKVALILLGFVVPLALGLWATLSHAGLPWTLAVVSLVPGLLAERWFFFAQARHPQNLYYQVVS